MEDGSTRQSSCARPAAALIAPKGPPPKSTHTHTIQQQPMQQKGRDPLFLRRYSTYITPISAPHGMRGASHCQRQPDAQGSAGAWLGRCKHSNRVEQDRGDRAAMQRITLLAEKLLSCGETLRLQAHTQRLAQQLFAVALVSAGTEKANATRQADRRPASGEVFGEPSSQEGVCIVWMWMHKRATGLQTIEQKYPHPCC